MIDGLDRDRAGAVGGAAPDVVVHQMTPLGTMKDFRNFDKEFAVTNELRTRGTDYLLEAAQQAGTRRFIAQSFVGWNNTRTGGPVKTEDDPLDPDPVPSTRKSMAAIRHVDETVPGRGPRGLVLRYGPFYGHGASDNLLDVVRKRAVARYRRGHGHLVVLRDHRRRRRDRRGRRPWRARHLQHRRRRPGPGAGVAAVPGRVHRRQGADARPGLAGRAARRPVRRLADDRVRGSVNEKAKRELGWAPSYASWRDGFRDWAKWRTGPCRLSRVARLTRSSGR